MQKPIEQIERLTYQECYEQIDRPLLLQQLEYVRMNSPFYREKLQRLGISLAEALNVDNFTSLPLTTKQELLAEQAEYPPFGRLATGIDPSSHRRVHCTSGSTGRAMYILMTANDAMDTHKAGRRAFECAGLGSDDTVIHCLNYCLWAGGLTDHLSLEATGATVIPFGVGNTAKLIETILQLRPSAISCTPSYLNHLDYVLQDKFSLKLQDLGLKKAFLGGEGGVQNPLVRARIENTWNIKAIDANYGMADVLSIFGAECGARQGLHFHGQGIVYIELVDPGSGEILPFQADQVGEMVITTLRREAQPVIRYRTRDLIRITATDRCACGRSSFRFLVVGRADDMISVRGVNVYPDSILTLLSEPPEKFSGEFQIVLESPPPIERPLVRVELASGLDLGLADELQAHLVRLCRQRLEFTPVIELVTFGGLCRTEGKTKRVIRTY